MDKYKNMTEIEIINIVKRNGAALTVIFTPNQYTDNIIEAALINDPNQLRYIPKDKLNEKLRIIAMKAGASIYFIDKEDRTLEILIEALKVDGFAVDHIDKEKMTYELWIIAIKQNGFAITRVNKEDRTDELISLALKGKQGKRVKYYL